MNRKVKISCLALAAIFLQSCVQKEPHDHAKMLAEEERNRSVDSTLTVVVRDPSQTVISSQSVVRPEVSDYSFEQIAEGYVAIDPQRNQKITTRIGGRIEKLYVRYDYQYVLKGEKLMDINSPEMRTAEEEYLYILTSGNDTAMLRTSKEKLFLLGLTQEQFRRLNVSGEVTGEISVYSPYDGYVKLNTTGEQMGAVSTDNTNDGMDQMQNSGQQTIALPDEGIIQEGSYIAKGQTLFVINDFRRVWVMLSSSESGYAAGTPLKLSSELWKDSILDAQIGFTEPIFADGHKYTSYRVYLDNPDHKLLLNSLVTARVQLPGRTRLELPASCVLSLGNRKIVWVKSGVTDGGTNIFETREVTVNQLPGDRVEITSGLSVNEEVALAAGFMIDSQSFISLK